MGEGSPKPHYPDEARRLAWRLYAEGRTHAEIVRRMKQEWPSFKESTLKRWITRYDWAGRRAKMDRASLLTESRVEQIITGLVEDLEGVRQVLSDELKRQAEKKKVESQTVYAFTGTIEKILKELYRHEKRIDYLGYWTKFYADLVAFLMGKDEELARSLDAHLDEFQDYVLETYGA